MSDFLTRRAGAISAAQARRAGTTGSINGASSAHWHFSFRSSMKIECLSPFQVINSREKCATVTQTCGATPIGGSTAASNTTPESSSNNSLSGIVIKPQFNARWKMFELDSVEGCGRACLVFPPKPDPLPNDSGSIHLDLTPTMPQVWFLDRAYEWHYLAPNFTTYFRMMLYHLGLPQWQLLFTPMGPTPWSKVSKLTFMRQSLSDKE